MTRASFSGRDRRAVVLGLAVLAPALLYRGAIKPYVDTLRETRDRAAVERDALAREHALLALTPQAPVLRRELDSVVSVAHDRLFSAPDDGIAAAEVGAYLGTLARAQSVWLRAADAREGKASSGGIRALPVDIQAESDFEGIRSFLHAMEQGPKLLRVDQVTITPGNDTSAARPVLQLRAVVTGYALRAPGASGGPTSTPSPSRSARR